MLHCRSGVRWRYADPGFALIRLASEDSDLSLQPSLERRNYIEGVICMLRGLPTDLTAEEELVLRDVIQSLVAPGTGTDGRCLARDESPRTRQDTLSTQQSALHQAVAAITLYVILAIAFLLPYVQVLGRQAYHFDRKHRLSERALNQGMIAADAVGRRTLTLAASFCALNDGEVGDSMREVGIYLVQGFSGGVYDGLGKALRLRAKRFTRSAEQEDEDE